MRYVAPLFVAFLTFSIVAACSSQSEKPARTVSCAGGIPTNAASTDAGSTCAGICLAAKNPCTDVELADAGSPQSCPAGYAFAPNRFSCAGGALCCLASPVEGGTPANDAAPTDAAPDAVADAALDSAGD